jgi:membrane associated rhomboid family serine protease
MFLHGGWMHLLGNMWFLWLFGNNIEEAMGRVRFLLFYLLTGLAASVFHAFTNLGSEIPTIGASGAISGVLGAYVMLYPHAQVLVLVPLGFIMRLMYIPAAFVLGFWFLLQLISGGLSSSQGGGVAWWAHVGGFVAGMLLCVVFKRRDVPLFSAPQEHARFLR